MFVSNLPLPILQFISEFLLYKSEICWKGIDQNPKMCLLEYLVTLNSFNKQFAINYAKQFINTYKNIKHIGWFINNPNNTDYLKIHRCIHLNDEEPIKYIINYTFNQYNFLIDRGHPNKLSIWEPYPSLFNSKKNFLIKLLALLTSCLELDHNDYYISTIININDTKWDIFSNILKTEYNILLDKPKRKDKLTILYSLKYMDFTIKTKSHIGIPYSGNHLQVGLTSNQLRNDVIKNSVRNNLKYIISKSYHYDDCFGERILDSVDPDIDEYKNILKYNFI
jgi:hypothetical protein